MKGVSIIAWLCLVAVCTASPCSLTVIVNPVNCTGENLACTVEDAISICQTMECEEKVECLIYSTAHLNHTGNSNLSYGPGDLDHIMSLTLKGFQVELNGNYFISLQDAGPTDFTLIYLYVKDGGTEPAIRVTMTDPASRIEMSTLTISNCSQGAMEVDSPGTLDLDISSLYIRRDGNCAMRIDAYETTVLNHAYANEMKAYDSHVTGNGGLLCLFGHSELVNLTLPRIECTECSASRGVRNNTTRAIGDLPLNCGWMGRVFYISRVRDDWYYKISSKHLPKEFDYLYLNRTEMETSLSGSTGDYGAIYATSTRSGARFEIEHSSLGPHYVNQDGGYRKTDYTGCQAHHGAAASCLGISEKLVDSNLKVYRSGSTSLDQPTLDFFSQGDCAGAMWDSQTNCPYLPNLCASCGGSVCSLSDYGCFCYCDTQEEEDGTCSSSPPIDPPASSPSVLPTPPSGTPSTSNSGPSFWAGFGVGVLVVFVFVLVVLAILAALSYRYKWHRVLRSDVEVIN